MEFWGRSTTALRTVHAQPCRPPSLPSLPPLLTDYVVSKDFGSSAPAAPATVHDKQDVGRLVHYYLRFDDDVVSRGLGAGLAGCSRLWAGLEGGWLAGWLTVAGQLAGWLRLQRACCACCVGRRAGRQGKPLPA